MWFSLKSFKWALFIILSVAVSACSEPAENSELEDVKRELAELKKEIEDNSKVDPIPEVIEPSADDIAFQKAKADGRVRAFGKYAKSFPDGDNFEAADDGAWASATRQSSVAAYEAYRLHFPNGKNAQQSYVEILKVQSSASEKALTDLGYSVDDFPSFGAVSLDSNADAK